MSSNFVLSEDERNALMEQVYGGYQRSPETKTWGRGSENNPRHRNAGKIDYAAYGGKASSYSDSMALDAVERSKKKGFGGDNYKYVGKKEYYGDAWRNRETWSKVADHLGIKEVDSQTDLRQMYDYVRGIGSKKEEGETKSEYKPAALPEGPYQNPPKDDRRDLGSKNVPGSIQYNPPSDNSELGRAISSVADYGNRGTDDYFGRFLPEMGERNTNEARATGRQLMSNIQRFQGKVPTLGSPKELFEYYLQKIKD